MAPLAQRLAVSSILVVAVPLAIGEAKSGASVTAPASASIGETITVSAKNLKPGHYAVRLYAKKVPNKNWACVAQLGAAAKKNVTHISVTAKIPSTLHCYSGFPSTSEGPLKAKPGTFVIVVSVPQSSITTAPGSSVARRNISVR
ncbi:MAG: hypothetical protein QOI20_3320 [Acidimicrobiaceae bacterium]|nr:hypothetical protein [Acidimicrobiaceae bacterium]